MKDKNGFLLLEVMLSVAILSIALVLILNSFMNSIRTIELSEDYFRANLLLEQRMFDLRNYATKRISGKGEFNDFGNRFSWDLDVEEIGDFLPKELNLRISWQERKKSHDVAIVTYL